MTDPTWTITDGAAALVRAARTRHCRYCIALTGPESWGRRIAREILLSLLAEQTLWIGDDDSHGVRSITSREAHQVLGAEFEALVYDAHAGFDPDAFAAVTGTLRGGGLLLLLTPPLDDWPSASDPDYVRMTAAGYGPADVAGRFLKRLVRVIGRSPAVFDIDPKGPGSFVIPDVKVEAAAEAISPPCRTADQARAVDAIVAMAGGRAGRPLVLTADRGRGKSAALGIAAARVLQSGVGQIVVTAPRLDAAAPVFRHAAALLPESKVAAGAVRWRGREIVFVPPDSLVRGSCSPRLLLVDEAAAIPAPMLTSLLRAHGRIVFSTTIHGYEGSGRGFALRFQADLEKYRPDGQTLHLEAPIRWAANDPLERFVSDALLLDASPAPAGAIAAATPSRCRILEIVRDELVGDDLRLSELFGLLVGAHYRTRPSDLRNLLDGPNVRVFAMTVDGHTVATALIAIEGGFDRNTARAVWAGSRRPRGHLLPQSLCAHAGIEEAATRRFARIMRIAVHPALQRRGMGRTLVAQLVEEARHLGCDLIGACFGATADLLDFWSAVHMLPVQVGITRNAASGSHSVTVLHALSTSGERIFVRARNRLAAQIPWLLIDPLRDMEAQIAAILMRSEDTHPKLKLSREEWRDVLGFAFAARGYELTLGPIRTLVAYALAISHTDGLIGARQQRLLVARVMQNHPWAQAADIAGYRGKAQALAALRETLQRLSQDCADERVRSTIDSLR